MSPPVTELALLPLKSGTDILSPTTAEGRIWQDTLSTVLSQPGAQRAYYSLEAENPSHLRLSVDWDTLDAHKTFIASPQYGPFVKDLLSVMDGGPALYHAEFAPHPPMGAYGGNSAFPVTEVLTMYFDASAVTQEQQEKLPGICGEFLGKLGLDGERKHAAGWVVEEVDSDKVEGEAGKKKAGKAKVFVGLVPWKSVEEHMATRETEAFKSNIHMLRDVPGLKGLEVYHVKMVTQQGEMGFAERGVGDVKVDAQEEVLNPQ